MVVITGEGCADVQWVEAMDAAKGPRMRRPAPPQTFIQSKTSVVPQVEKP